MKKHPPSPRKPASPATAKRDPRPTAAAPQRKVSNPPLAVKTSPSERDSQIRRIKAKLEEIRAYKRILAEEGLSPDVDDKERESSLIVQLLRLEKGLDAKVPPPQKLQKLREKAAREQPAAVGDESRGYRQKTVKDFREGMPGLPATTGRRGRGRGHPDPDSPLPSAMTDLKPKKPRFRKETRPEQ